MIKGLVPATIKRVHVVHINHILSIQTLLNDDKITEINLVEQCAHYL